MQAFGLDRARTTVAQLTDRGRRLATVDTSAWLIVVVVAFIARYQPSREQLVILALIGAGIVIAVSRRPDVAIIALVVGYPFNTIVLSYMHAIGIPTAIVKNASYWKELMVAGCVVAAIRQYRRGGHRLDWIDRMVALYVGIVALYYLFPTLFVHASGPYAIGPPTDRETLNLALRGSVLFLVLFVAVRHLELDRAFRKRFARAIFATGVVVGGLGVFEYLFSNSWNDFMVNTVQVPRYRIDVLGVFTFNPNDIRIYSNGVGSTVRIGSVFFDQLQLGAWLVLPLAIGIQRMIRSTRQLFVVGGSATVAAALLLTQTRAAILAALIATVVLLRPSADGDVRGRVRFAAIGIAGLILLGPLALSSGVVDRTTGSGNGGEASTTDHIERTHDAFDRLLAEPLGRGLGTGPSIGARFNIANATNAENFYLQVGNETGAVSMVAFVAVVFLVIRRVRSARAGPDVLGPSFRAAFLGLSVAALLLHIWSQYSLALTMWGGLGLLTAVGGEDRRGALTA